MSYLSKTTKDLLAQQVGGQWEWNELTGEYWLADVTPATRDSAASAMGGKGIAHKVHPLLRSVSVDGKNEYDPPKICLTQEQAFAATKQLKDYGLNGKPSFLADVLKTNAILADADAQNVGRQITTARESNKAFALKLLSDVTGLKWEPVATEDANASPSYRYSGPANSCIHLGLLFGTHGIPHDAAGSHALGHSVTVTEEGISFIEKELTAEAKVGIAAEMAQYVSLRAPSQARAV